MDNCPEVVAEATDPTSSGVLWTRLAKLFTLLSLKNPIYECHQEVDDAMTTLLNDSKSLIFPEDFLMRGVSSLGDQQISQAHQTAKWNGISAEPLGDEGDINEVRTMK